MSQSMDPGEICMVPLEEDQWETLRGKFRERPESGDEVKFYYSDDAEVFERRWPDGSVTRAILRKS